MQNKDAIQETIVQNQLEAYNNQRDLTRLLSFYSNDITIYDYNETTPFIDGIEALKTVYFEVFEDSPKLNASIKNRIVFDNKIIEEEVTGREGIDFVKVIVIYEIESNLIKKVTFIRER